MSESRAQMSLECLIDLGGAPILETVSLNEALAHVKKISGLNPTGVVYPALSAAGPNWPSALFDKSYLPDPKNAPGGMTSVLRQCRAQNLSIWLEFSLEMGFAANSTSHIVDQKGSSSAHCCINSLPFRKSLNLLMKEARQLLDADKTPLPLGIVLTAQDLWPMGATGEKAIDLTCFCPYCIGSMKEAGFNEIDRFKFYPSPMNLVMENSGTGLRHLHAFGPQTDAVTLIEYSRAHGFIAKPILNDIKEWQLPQDSKEWERLVSWAEALLRYVRVRQLITFNALQKIVEETRRIFPEQRIAIVAEGMDYDWTAGFFFEDLQRQQFFDELWVTPPTSRRLSASQNCRLYASERARYFVQSLYAAMELVRSPFRQSVSTSDALKAHIQTIARLAHPAILNSPLGFQSLDYPANCQGVVIPVAAAHFTEQIVSSLLPENEQPELSQASRLEMMQQFLRMMRSSSGETE